MEQQPKLHPARHAIVSRSSSASIHRSAWRDCPKSLVRVRGVVPRSAEKALFEPFRLPTSSEVRPGSVAQAPFRTVSEGLFFEVRLQDDPAQPRDTSRTAYMRTRVGPTRAPRYPTPGQRITQTVDANPDVYSTRGRVQDSRRSWS